MDLVIAPLVLRSTYRRRAGANADSAWFGTFDLELASTSGASIELPTGSRLALWCTMQLEPTAASGVRVVERLAGHLVLEPTGRGVWTISPWRIDGLQSRFPARHANDGPEAAWVILPDRSTIEIDVEPSRASSPPSTEHRAPIHRAPVHRAPVHRAPVHRAPVTPTLMMTHATAPWCLPATHRSCPPRRIPDTSCWVRAQSAISALGSSDRPRQLPRCGGRLPNSGDEQGGTSSTRSGPTATPHRPHWRSSMSSPRRPMTSTSPAAPSPCEPVATEEFATAWSPSANS